MGFSFPIYDGGWYFQSAVTSQGASMANADETEVTVGGDAGVFGATLLRRLVEETGMKHMGGGDARKLFRAGRLGMLTQFGCRPQEPRRRDRRPVRSSHRHIPGSGGRRSPGRGAATPA